ncbi:MAG: integrin alpha [Planctomycetota bacterium]|jgi:hypothetical protein|nr:integrin alpha [Planctomycetota bacterium]MDP6762275.1 integrin alpha [Planctomycetota bacterium]MDP6990015.1 integrin alpha [Planctomycetota bacterium]
MARFPVSLVLALSISAVPAAAQFPAFTLSGDDVGDFHGYAVGDAGDVNSDGFEDFVIGAPKDDNTGNSAGSVRIHSGADGSVLYMIDGGGTDQLGTAVGGAGDVNNDGFADVIAGGPWHLGIGPIQGTISVISGADGSVLYQIEGPNTFSFFGGAVDGAGDLDNDGFDEFIVGASNDDGNGSDSGLVYVYGGIDGALIYMHSGDGIGDQMGSCVAGLGDVNNDGVPDYGGGAPLDDNNGNNSGSAQVWSGIDGSVLYAFNGNGADHQFGKSMAALGDVNGDAHADFIVGEWHDALIGHHAGSVTVFSGIDGSVIRQHFGQNADEEFGQSVAGIGDYNGDGIGDYAVGAPGGGASGEVLLYSGADGSQIGSAGGTVAGAEFGAALAGGMDVNNDGLGEFIVGAHLTQNATGEATVFSSISLLGTAYCFGDGSATACPCGNNGPPGVGCGNSTGGGAGLVAGGSTSVSADNIEFDASGLLPGQPALLFSGMNAVNNGQGVAFGDGLRCAGGTVKRLGVRVPDSAGDASWGPGLAPLGEWGPGDVRRFQCWYRDPNGSPCGSNFNLSHGYEVTFTP